MKLLRYSCVGLAIVLGFIAIVASGPTPTPGYVDSDGDGYGNPSLTCGSIEEPDCVADNTDCDDSDEMTYPGAAESDSTTECMTDADEDGYGSDSSAAGAAGTDCDDSEPSINPGEVEDPGNRFDENCDGCIEDYSSGRFRDICDGTVRDNVSGLIWLKRASVVSRNWNNAQGHAADWTYDGSPWHEDLHDGSVPGDWRIPTLAELLSLVDNAYTNPALSNIAGDGQWSEGDVFTGVIWGDRMWADGYWSSETKETGLCDIERMYPHDTCNYAIFLGDGLIYSMGMTYVAYVWPVRDAF